MKKTILMSVGLSALLLSSPVLAKSSHVSLNVNPVTGNQTSVSGETTKLATIKVLHNKTLLGKGTASKRGTFKVRLKVPIKNGWKYTIQATKKGFAAKKYTVTALYASTKADQAQSNNYQDEIHDLQNTIISLQSQLNDLKNKQSTTTVVSSDNAQTANTWLAYQKQIDALNDQMSSIDNQIGDYGDPLMAAEANVNFYRTHTSDSINKEISDSQNEISEAQEEVNKNLDDYQAQQKLENAKDILADFQNQLKMYDQISSDINISGNVDNYLNNAKSKVDEYNKLKAEEKNLSNQIDELQQKQAAVLNSLS